MKENRSLAPVLLLGALVPCLCLVLYVLSIGPVLYLDRLHTGNSPRWISVVYAPLFWACKNSESVADVLDAYADMWTGDS